MRLLLFGRSYLRFKGRQNAVNDAKGACTAASGAAMDENGPLLGGGKGLMQLAVRLHDLRAYLEYAKEMGRVCGNTEVGPIRVVHLTNLSCYASSRNGNVANQDYSSVITLAGRIKWDFVRSVDSYCVIAINSIPVGMAFPLAAVMFRC